MNQEHFMRRALELAVIGLGKVSPNPMVGCVIEYGGNIIGEGWHSKFGGPHAEVQAINSVKDKSLLAESTIYITLEPCNYHGKTPACTDIILKHAVKKVVIGAIDPNPKVAGKGIEILQSAGIETVVGVMEEEASFMNRRFKTFMTKKRPYTTLKWAETSDGFIARNNNDSKWISNQYSRQLVHKWRGDEDAVLVGKNTVVHDNPHLTVRNWLGDDPLRIVLDRKLSLSSKYNVFDGEVGGMIYNTIRSGKEDNNSFECLPEKGFLQAMMNDLYKRDVGSVLVEGGAEVLNSFIESDLWDEARIFITDKKFNKGIKAPLFAGSIDEELIIMGDCLQICYNHK